MIAKVIRTGQHSGGDKFVEVQETPSSPHYAVPVNAELAVGDEVEILVTLHKKAQVVEAEEIEVGTRTAPELVVETSPIAPENSEAADTAPSGQSSDEGVEQAEEMGEDVGASVSAPKQGKLPEDFPGHAALAEAGINTFGQLRKAGDVTEIEGIGPATAKKIEEALEEE